MVQIVATLESSRVTRQRHREARSRGILKFHVGVNKTYWPPAVSGPITSTLNCCIAKSMEDIVSSIDKDFQECQNNSSYYVSHNGLQRQRQIGSAVAGFNQAKTITKASATDLHARKDY